MSRCIASASTGSQTSSGAASSSMRALTQLWWRSPRSKKATSGPVSTMAEGIASKGREMLGIGSKIGNAGVDNAARTLHQRAQRGGAPRRIVSAERQPQTLLDQVLDLAAAPGRFDLGLPIEFVGDFDRRFHGQESLP